MLFNSLEFPVFFIAVVLFCAVLPTRARWVLLLLASYLFYAAWEPGYLALIAVSTLVDFAVGLAMGRRSDRRARRPWLIASLVANLGLLFTFKYYDFFRGSLTGALAAFDVSVDLPALDLLLPVGISFYTFQTLSYTLDVYRGDRPPERHLGFFALYVAFFPQLVAGPIERSTRLLPQLRGAGQLDVERMRSGLLTMLKGFALKIVVADRLAIYVNAVYGDPDAYAGAPVALATYFFAFQIYCDFAGYSAIAIGAARVLGVDLMENFRRPYLAASVREFWGRWHISLSTWFRDYLYIPLGGSRRGPGRRAVSVFVVFLLSGLWHGANWTFLAWGALHGAFMLGGMLGRLRADSARAVSEPHGFRRVVAVLVTFHLVLIAWMLFRADDLASVGRLVTSLAPGAEGARDFLAPLAALGSRAAYEFWLSVACVVGLVVVQLVEERVDLLGGLLERPVWIRWPVVYALLLAILMLGEFNLTEFIYFQF